MNVGCLTLAGPVSGRTTGMNLTDTTHRTRSRLGAQGVAVVLLALLLTACPIETKLPTVTLAGVASVTTESTLMLTAIAAPAVGSGFNSVGPAITKVELYDGVKKLTEKTASPYVFEVKLTATDNGKKQFKAKAYDQAGTIGESNTVTVDVNIAVPDTTPPTVVSVDPPNGATGVTNDKAITVTFSKPMNQQATQAAFQSVDLPLNAVTFAWSTDGKVMTVKPNAPLEYKAVSSPSDVSRTYAFSLTSTATDVVGNKLGQSNVAFSTLKQVTTTIQSSDDLTGWISDKGGSSLSCAEICIGDDANNFSLRGMISFDISSLDKIKYPIIIKDAKLSYNVFSSTPETTDGRTYPYLSLYFSDRLNNISGFNVSYIESLSYNDLSLVNYDNPGSFHNLIRKYYVTSCFLVDYCNFFIPLIGPNSFNTLDSFKDDWNNRTIRLNRSQFRFRFAAPTNSDNQAQYLVIDRTGSKKPTLEVVFLMP